MLTYLKRQLKSLFLSDIIIKFLISLSAVSFFETAFSTYNFNAPEFFINTNTAPYFICVALIFLSLLLINLKPIEPYILLALLTSLFFITNLQSNNVFFAAASSLLISSFVFYFSKQIKSISLTKKTTIFISICLGILFTLFVGGITIVKYLNHRTPNFDFGIFAQMFQYMKETLIPYTTCERDMLLSHFAVHFSPVFYLILPIYYIFPTPITLLAFQAFIAALGILPLYKICKHFNLSNTKICIIVALYVLHPTVIANNFYYFHENCFLTFFLLSLFYFAEKGKTFPTYLFAFLTMTVKEDAAVYVFFFALYLIFSNKRKKKGFILLSMSTVYFLVVTRLMTLFGNGIMSNRYDNFIFEPDGTLLDVVINVFKNPAFLFEQILSAEKIEFLILMLLPLAFLPFAIKKPSRIILLGPLVLINLMTDYPYQFDIGFQYTYASIAFLFYLLIMNITELDKAVVKKMLISAFLASIIFFSSTNLNRIQAFDTYANDKEQISIINQTLDTIPEDKSIRSSTFFIPALYDRKEVYEYYYSDEKTDYVIFDLRWGEKDLNKFLLYEGDCYENIIFITGIIAVYEAK